MEIKTVIAEALSDTWSHVYSSDSGEKITHGPFPDRAKAELARADFLKHTGVDPEDLTHEAPHRWTATTGESWRIVRHRSQRG